MRSHLHLHLYLHLHRRAATAVALLATATLALGGGVVAPAGAAPLHPAAPAAPARTAAVITNKVTLPDTSIDGPGLASVGTTSVIAWTGRDAARHLNVEISRDGLHFDPATKLTLNETSPVRPDVTLLTEGLPISVAWTGTDPNHSLNLRFGVYQRPEEKLTLRDNSFTAPALVQGASGPNGNTLYLAWTGADPNHSLNFLPITEHGGAFTLGTKQILSRFSSDAGPHLALRGGTTIVLTWTSRAGQPQVAVAGGDLKFGPAATLAQASAFAPDTVSFQSEGQPGDWIGWTGTDPAHHLNLQWTTHFPSFPDPAHTKTVLGDTAFGGPALAFNAGPQIAWTGTDPAHHLNIARFVMQ